MGGFAVLSILLHNDSSVMCTLTGNATATVVGSTGAAILTSTPIAGATNLGNYAVTTVAVPSGGEAQLFVGFGGGACPAGSALEIAIPGAAAPLTFSATPATGMCGSQLETSPFVPPAVQLFSSYPPIPSSSPDISTASACSGSNLAGTQGQVIPDGSNTDVELILTNVSTAPCSLGSRWPAVNVSGGTTSVIGSFTAWMPSYIATLGGSEQPNSSLTLAPDSGAVAFIELPTTGSGIDCVAPTLAHITLPRSSVSLSVSLSDPSLQICADESTPTNPSQTTTGSSIYVTPISLATSPMAKVSSGVSPDGDGSGYYYGTDSGGAPCEDSSPYQISYNGLTGGCGFYGGQMGGYWGLRSGCSNSGWAWVESQADSADHIYSGGVGAVGVYFLGGAGIDPKLTPGGSLDYTGGTPTTAQLNEATSWGEQQASEWYNTDYSINDAGSYLEQPVIFMDIEGDSGWDGEYSGCQAWYSVTLLNSTYNDQLNRNVFNGFFDWIQDNASGWSLGVYCDPSEWNAWVSGNNLSTVYEWTNSQLATSQASGSNRPLNWSMSEASADFFAGLSQSSSKAVAWQWAQYSNTPGQTADLDQVQRSRWPA
jgi:hypothetical protein